MRWLAMMLFVVSMFCGCSGGKQQFGLGGDTVTLAVQTVTGRRVNAALVAFQDGSGAWVKLAPTNIGVYTSTITSAEKRFGFLVIEDAAASDIYCYYGATNEVANIPHIFTAETTASDGPYVLAGGVTGMNGQQIPRICWGPYTAEYDQVLSRYSIEGLPASNNDLCAARYPLNSHQPDALYLQRNMPIFGDKEQTLDFTKGMIPDEYEVEFDHACDEAGVDWHAADQSALSMGRTTEEDGQRFTYAALPGNAQSSSDVYELYINAEYVQRRQFFARAMRKQIELDYIETFGSNSCTGTTFTWEAYPEAKFTGLRAQGQGITWHIMTTPQGLPDLTYTLPSLTGIDGWQNRWNITRIDSYYFYAVLGNRTPAQLLQVVEGYYPAGLELTVVYPPTVRPAQRGGGAQERGCPFARR